MNFERDTNERKSAFDAIALSQLETVRRIGVSMLRNRDELEDFVQEVFTRVYGSRDQLRDVERMPQWVAVIARNTVYEWNRRKQPLPMESLTDEPSEPPTVLAQIEAEERRKALLNAMNSLNPVDRNLVHDFYFREATYDDLREQSGLSYANLRSRLSRARSEMSRYLAKAMGILWAWLLPPRKARGFGELPMRSDAMRPAMMLTACLMTAGGLGIGAVLSAQTTETTPVQEAVVLPIVLLPSGSGGAAKVSPLIADLPASPSPTAQTDQLLPTRTVNASSVVRMVAWRPDGRVFATGCMDKTAKLWDASTGELLRTLSGHENDVWAVAWSPDGRTLATGSWDRTVKLWDASTGVTLRTLSESGAVYSVAWSPDGRTLATGSRDTTVKLWDASTGELLRTLTGHSSYVLSVAWSPDGRTLATGSDDLTVKLWDVASGTLLRTLCGHTWMVAWVAWSPDGHTLATAALDKTAKLWDAASGTLIRTLSGHTMDLNSVSWSPDGRLLATGSDDRTAKLWDAETGNLLRTLSGHEDDVNSALWSSDGHVFITGSDDGTVKLWDATKF